MNVQTLLEQFASTLRSIEESIGSIPDARAAEQPNGVLNHPAWTLAHLCVGHDFALRLMGRATICPPEWMSLAGPGSKPDANRARFPTCARLLQMLADAHAAMDAAVRETPPDVFEKPTPESIRAFAPTIGHVVCYMLVGHENYHLAQLAVWKRAAGLTG